LKGAFFLYTHMSILNIFGKKDQEKDKNGPEVEGKDDVVSSGLKKTKMSLLTKLGKAIAGKSKVDPDFLDELEEVLITSDVGVETTLKVIERVEARAEKDKYFTEEELALLVRDEMTQMMIENHAVTNTSIVPDNAPHPYVIMVVGVNGVGKTTTIGKLATQLKKEGKKVLLGAADTFRAAAVDQLIIWAERSGVDIVSHGMNTDPASVAFDTVKKGTEENYDVVIIDTAGRLHNKVNLMNELTKIRRVMTKFSENAPHEVSLVLDASTGQNAIEQAKQFTQATQVNSLALTKLDGTAKGGVAIGISDQFKVPIKYVGLGEGMNDLKLFDPRWFVKSIFE
jgi:fused signal recognition particle receptor